jgi:hypothetical protein
MTRQRDRIPAIAARRTTLPGARQGRRHERLPDLRPAAGHYLLAGIDAVLPGLDSTPDVLELADELRVALARTAACGDTCRVRPAADAVRLAVNLVLAGCLADARLELVRARSELGARSADR